MNWFSLIGTISFALSGYLIGVKKSFDLLGIIILAILTAIGGGILRDVLVNRVPLAFTDSSAIGIIFLSLLVAWLLKLHRKNDLARNQLFIVSDSIGLAAFSIAGAQVGLQAELNLFGVLFLGFLTAVGGGIVRDMMVNDIPFILHEDFYGTVAIFIAGSLFLLKYLGATHPIWQYVLFSIGLGLRLLAHQKAFRLPKV